MIPPTCRAGVRGPAPRAARCSARRPQSCEFRGCARTELSCARRCTSASHPCERLPEVRESPIASGSGWRVAGPLGADRCAPSCRPSPGGRSSARGSALLSRTAGLNVLPGGGFPKPPRSPGCATPDLSRARQCAPPPVSLRASARSSRVPVASGSGWRGAGPRSLERSANQVDLTIRRCALSGQGAARSGFHRLAAPGFAARSPGHRCSARLLSPANFAGCVSPTTLVVGLALLLRAPRESVGHFRIVRLAKVLREVPFGLARERRRVVVAPQLWRLSL